MDQRRLWMAPTQYRTWLSCESLMNCLWLDLPTSDPTSKLGHYLPKDTKSHLFSVSGSMSFLRFSNLCIFYENTTLKINLLKSRFIESLHHTAILKIFFSNSARRKTWKTIRWTEMKSLLTKPSNVLPKFKFAVQWGWFLETWFLFNFWGFYLQSSMTYHINFLRRVHEYLVETLDLQPGQPPKDFGLIVHTNTPPL